MVLLWWWRWRRRQRRRHIKILIRCIRLREIRISIQGIDDPARRFPRRLMLLLWQGRHTRVSGPLLVETGCQVVATIGGIRHVRILGGCPTPLFMQVVDDELDAPAAFAFDAGKDLEDFFLLPAVREAFGSNGKTSERGGCDATEHEHVCQPQRV